MASATTSAFMTPGLPSSNTLMQHPHTQIQSTNNYPRAFLPQHKAVQQGALYAVAEDNYHSKKSNTSSDSQKEDEEQITGIRKIFSWGKDRIPVVLRRNKAKKIGKKDSTPSASAKSLPESTTTPANDVSSVSTTLPQSSPLEENTKKASKRSQKHPNIHLVETLQEYKDVVATETEKIVVVRFYAEWCKACKAIRPSYNRIANVYNKENIPVKFVEVPLTKENAFLHQGLGVPSLPFGHIYYPKVGLIEERKIAKKKFKVFEKVLETYVHGSCDCDYELNEEGELGVVPADKYLVDKNEDANDDDGVNLQKFTTNMRDRKSVV